MDNGLQLETGRYDVGVKKQGVGRSKAKFERATPNAKCGLLIADC